MIDSASRAPRRRWLLLVGFVAGAATFGLLGWSVEITSSESFCLSCHEMREIAYAELEQTEHHTNRSGVRATCPDCHVPKPWPDKMARKVRATAELYHQLVGTIDTPEKYDARRLAMARRVWSRMQANDSRECRSCHDVESMVLRRQSRAAQKKHKRMTDEGQTCIDCHQGVAHELPEGWEEVESS